MVYTKARRDRASVVNGEGFALDLEAVSYTHLRIGAALVEAAQKAGIYGQIKE